MPRRNLSRLTRLKKGWNGYDADPPDETAVRIAEAFLATAGRLGDPDDVDASAVGGIGITFRENDRKVYLEFDNEGHVLVLFVGGQPRPKAEKVPVDEEGYGKLVPRISEYLGKEPSWPFVFDREKTIQATAAFLERHASGETSRRRLLALLYLLDRESLRDTNRTVTGDVPVLTEHGPAPRTVGDLISETHDGEHRIPWDEYFGTKDDRVFLRKSPGVGRLTRHEIRKIAELVDRYDASSDESVVERLRDELGEWKKEQGDDSRVVPLHDILEAVGREHDLEDVLRDTEERKAIDRFFH